MSSNDPFPDDPAESPRGWRDQPGQDPDVRPADLGSTPGWGIDPSRADAERPASVGKRVGAYIIDYVLVTIVLGIVLALVDVGTGIVPVSAEGVDRGQAYVSGIITAGLLLTYFVLLEAGSGQTLGKRMLGIKVVMADGSPMTLQAAFKRRVLFFVGVLIPVAGGLINFVVPLAALITAIQDEPANQGFHDRWAATKVVEA